MSGKNIMANVSMGATYYAIDCASVLEQGYIGVLGQPDSDGVRPVTAPAAITTLGLVVHVSVPMEYDADKAQADFSLAIGEVGRAIVPYKGMELVIPDANILNATVKGQFVIPDAGEFKMEAAAALGGTESLAFVVDDKITDYGVAMSVLRCIKA